MCIVVLMLLLVLLLLCWSAAAGAAGAAALLCVFVLDWMNHRRPFFCLPRRCHYLPSSMLFSLKVDLQAMERAHHVGQTKPVKMYRLVCRGSVEERMVRTDASATFATPPSERSSRVFFLHVFCRGRYETFFARERVQRKGIQPMTGQSRSQSPGLSLIHI